jgi:hypothetical protein
MHPLSKARVKAVFLDSTLHFEIAPETPLEELCLLLGSYAKGHSDPLFVEVSLPTASAARITL